MGEDWPNSMICGRLIILFFGILIAFASSVSVFAQSANQLPPLPCMIFGQSNTIFVGQVVSMKPDVGNGEEESVLLEFAVREALVGSVQGAKVVVRSSAYYADYMGIATGKLFVVYSTKDVAGSVVTLNPATKPVNKAGAELEFLRKLDQRDPGATVFGRVSLVIKSSLDKDSRQPLTSAGLRIRSEIGQKLFETATDADGNYEIAGLPAGWYIVDVILPEGGNFVSEGNQGQLISKGCSEADIDVKARNQVRGKIVDTEGKPVGRVPLELVPFDYVKPRFDVNEPEERTGSNDDGSFTFSNIPPGKYVLAVNHNILPEKQSPFPTSFFPGTSIRSKAKIIDVEAGKEVDGLTFVLRTERLKEKKVTGRVVFPDGRPAPGTQVYLKEDENEVCCVLNDNVVTDSQGNFVLDGFSTRTYRIWAFIDHKPFTQKVNFIGASSVFALGNDTRPFQIILRPTSKESLDAIDEIEQRERGKLK